MKVNRNGNAMHLTLSNVFARVCGVALLVLLSGCDLVGNIFSSTEDRINSAFPLSDPVRDAVFSTLEIATGDKKKELEEQIDARLKLRAISCAKGYLPTWHSSVEDIRKALVNKACFSQADDEISQWLNLRKVGLILAQPPLVPLPEPVPSGMICYSDKFDDPNLPGEMKTTVTLTPVSCGTEIAIVQEGVPEVIPVEMCYLGWQESLAQLANLVEPEIAD